MSASTRRIRLATRPVISIRTFLSSELAFCILIAALMVLLRLVSFDYHAFFKTETIPNHDMYQGASFFTTSMHSMRLSGDIAWWNPTSQNGYAQYYQSFLSPLAPTSHHIVFILWAQCVRLLSFGGIAVPEYFQYLIITYIVLPFLTFLTFAFFTGRIFVHRTSTLLALIAYTFSGIGLWNSAWFYFQEPFVLFFLLATCIGLLQRPSIRRTLLCIAAIIIQITSFNYWTLYNSWFIILFLVAYSLMYKNQVYRLYVRVANILRQYRRWVLVITGWSVIVVIIWGTIIGSIAADQANNYIRSDIGNGGKFTVIDVYDRIKEIRQFTTELFNPSIQRAIASYKLGPEPDIHNARYIGAFFLPFLALLPVYRWGRRERWLILSACGVLIICIGPPFLLALWDVTPFMNRIRHFFYFYTQYWQLMVMLLSGVGLDILLSNRYNVKTRQRFVRVISGIVLIIVFILLGLSFFSQMFPTGDLDLQANLRFAILILFVGVAALQFLLFPTKISSRLLSIIVLLLALGDLSNYFWNVNTLDEKFTQSRWAYEIPLEAQIQDRLHQTWLDPDTTQGFNGGVSDNMPPINNFWPINIYMNHRFIVDLQTTPGAIQNYGFQGPSLGFYTSVKRLDLQDVATTFADNPSLLLNNKVLLLQNAPADTVLSTLIPHPQDNDIHFDVSNSEQWTASRAALILHNGQETTWRVNQDPVFSLKQPINLCASDYTYFYIRMAASPDIVERNIQLFYSLNYQNVFSETQSLLFPLISDGDMHSYVFSMQELHLNPQDHITGLRFDPVLNGSATGQSQIRVADLRLVRGDGSSTCGATSTTPADDGFAYTWDKWSYNAFSFTIQSPQAGWLLIRQLYDPLWHLTIDNQPVQGVQANTTGMAIQVPQGKHIVRMDYLPLARRLYWPACFLLEGLLLTLAVLAIRPGNAAYPASPTKAST